MASYRGAEREGERIEMDPIRKFHLSRVDVDSELFTAGFMKMRSFGPGGGLGLFPEVSLTCVYGLPGEGHCSRIYNRNS